MLQVTAISALANVKTSFSVSNRRYRGLQVGSANRGRKVSRNSSGPGPSRPDSTLCWTTAYGCIDFCVAGLGGGVC